MWSREPRKREEMTPTTMVTKKRVERDERVYRITFVGLEVFCCRAVGAPVVAKCLNSLKGIAPPPSPASRRAIMCSCTRRREPHRESPLRIGFLLRQRKERSHPNSRDTFLSIFPLTQRQPDMPFKERLCHLVVLRIGALQRSL